MTTQTKRRILGGVAATFLTTGLFWAYQRYAQASQLDEMNKLSAQLRAAPRGKNEELMKKFRVQMAKLTPDERMDFFEKGMDDRIDEYFKKSPAERKAWLAEMSKNRRRFGGPPGKGQRPTVKGKTGTARGKTLAKGTTGTAKGKGEWWCLAVAVVVLAAAGRGGGAVVGEALRAACPAASRAARQDNPRATPSVRNSSRPCEADEAEVGAGSAGALSSALQTTDHPGRFLESEAPHPPFGLLSRGRGSG
ncbi:MAG: hypothetical protein WKF75_01280 [Singulisphaera sp.]